MLPWVSNVGRKQWTAYERYPSRNLWTSSTNRTLRFLRNIHRRINNATTEVSRDRWTKLEFHLNYRSYCQWFTLHFEEHKDTSKIQNDLHSLVNSGHTIILASSYIQISGNERADKNWWVEIKFTDAVFLLNCTIHDAKFRVTKVSNNVWNRLNWLQKTTKLNTIKNTTSLFIGYHEENRILHQ